ncbi:MAG: thioredoxin family protein [Desulfosalsimonas sp.]
MSKKLVYLMAAAAMFVLILGLGAAFSNSDTDESNNAEIRWYSYEDGVNQIKKSDKKGYLHFYTDWCGYCKKMEAETFSDDDVADSLNQDFVAIKINAENKPDIAKQYGAEQFPFSHFTDGQNEPIGNQPGFIPPDVMVHLLKYLATDNYKKMRFDEFMDNRQ